MIKKIRLLLVFLVVFAAKAQQTALSENTKISVLTVGMADQSHSLYGHTAIRISDPITNLDVVYNYGMFDFATKNFMLKFVKGDMQYFAVAYPYQDFEYSYRLENRSIYEQVLNLNLQEKQNLFDKLNTSLASDDKFYTYKFIDRNCTTKVIAILNQILVGKPIVKKNTKDETYRQVLFPFVNNDFYQQLGINIIFGAKVDRQATLLFLPFDLLDNLKVIKHNKKPLAQEVKTLFEAKNPKKGFSFTDSIYSLIAVLLLILIINKKAVNVLYFTILGLIGLLFSVIGCYTFHEELLWNYNILLFNPLLLILVFYMLKNNPKMIKKMSLICLIILGIYTIYMFTKVHFWIVLPIIICNGLILLRLILKKDKNILLPSVK
jgi:Domain of unknown function (DUF4105)